MNKSNCPHCLNVKNQSAIRTTPISNGRYYRKSDRKWIRTFRCRDCQRHFSSATRAKCTRQKKRYLNRTIGELLCSGVSQRRIAKLLKISRTTVARKLIFLGQNAQSEWRAHNLSKPQCEIVEFDDLETSEHTKLKPLSVTLAVEHKTRRILGFQISQMPAKGPLAKLSIKKYGYRKDLRAHGRKMLFSELKDLVSPAALFKSDENPHYPSTVKQFFPQATHLAFPGQRGSVAGQGELKKIRFDPIFSLNHTCAMLRANINRLFRSTWCTTKKPERLHHHLAIYAHFHNLRLIGP